ncbi:MAG: LptA/OstA family protein [bacterium]
MKILKIGKKRNGSKIERYRFKSNSVCTSSIFRICMLIMLSLLSLNILAAGYTYAAAAVNTSVKAGITQSKTKIHITSNSLIVNNKKKFAIFTGKVIAIKGNLKIFSQNLKVFYNGKNKIKTLLATGNVHIIKGTDNITGQKAVFNNIDKIVTITGHPLAWSGKNRITGKIIEMNLKTGVSHILSGPGKRVNAVIYSKKSLSIQKKPLNSIQKKPSKQN